MKCPSCGGEVPHVALKCKHCGTALKKQAPPPAAAKPAPKAPRPDDPLKALAKEALAQQKSKQGPTKGDARPAAADPKAQAKKKVGTGDLAPGKDGKPAAPAEGAVEEIMQAKPVDPRRRLMINAGIGVALVIAALIGWRTDAAQNYITTWAAGAAVRDLPFDNLEAEYLGAGTGQLRVPDGYTELEGMPAGTRGLSFQVALDLAFRGRREAAFTLVGKRLKYEDALAQAKGIDPLAREFTASYGKNAFRTIRYKQAPADGAVGKLQTMRFYQSKKETENPLTIEFGYEANEQNGVIIDKLIDRVLTSVAE